MNADRAFFGWNIHMVEGAGVAGASEGKSWVRFVVGDFFGARRASSWRKARSWVRVRVPS